MTQENQVKKCALDNCYEYNLLLTKCDQCGKNYCDQHFRDHGCIQIENIVYECEKCHKIITEDMLDTDYKSRNIKNIKILNVQCAENYLLIKKLPKKLSGIKKLILVDEVASLLLFSHHLTCYLYLFKLHE